MERFRPRKPTTRETALAAGLAGLVGVAGHMMNSETGEPAGKDDATDNQLIHHTRGIDQGRASPEQFDETSGAVPDHETYREQMGDEVLRRLSDLDPNFSITRTTKVNGQPVTDEFFGINYQMPDGNHVPLADVYPNEETHELQLNPAEELSRWKKKLGAQFP
jgi:hypothetical protein